MSLTVTAVNDAPVAANDSYSTNEDTPLTVAAPGVLANDTDIDSPTLTAVRSSPARRTAPLTLNANGSFTYTPAANYNGADSFTYKANDGTLDSNTRPWRSRSRRQRRAGRRQRQLRHGNEDTPLTVAAPGVARPTTPTSTATTLTAILVEPAPAHGTLTLERRRRVHLHARPPTTTARDSFTYKANDGTLDSNIVTVDASRSPPSTTRRSRPTTRYTTTRTRR